MAQVSRSPGPSRFADFSCTARRLAWICIAVLLLHGCGGGGGGDSGGGGGGTQNFIVSTSAGTGGSISPSSTSVTQGATATFTVTPESNHTLISVSGCGGSLSGNTYTTGPITGTCTLTATFALQTYTVTTNVTAGGSVTPGNASVEHGQTAEFAITADTGFEIDLVSGCGGTLAGFMFTTAPVTAHCIVSAQFISESGAPPGMVGALNWLAPLPHGNLVNDLHVFDDNRIIAVANNGSITLTNDGGQTWERMGSPSAEHLHAVYFIGDTGWIVGAGGTILRSIDGGQSWNPEAWGAQTNFNAVYFVDELTGWAVGGGTFGSTKIAKSTDGGVTWSGQASDTGTSPLYDVSFISDQMGWIVGAGGTIIHTTDGGQSWVNQDSGTTIVLRAVHFVDAHTGWVGRQNGVMRTDDGGQSWTLQDTGGGNFQHLYFLDENVGWAVALQRIMFTTNGGQNWTRIAQNRLQPTTSSYFVDASIGFGSGTGGNVLHTVDGGDNWAYIAGEANTFHSMSFVSESVGWGVGPRQSVFRTADGGLSWTAQDAGAGTDSFNDVHFIDSSLGWIVGDTDRIFRTTDGGNQWQEIPTGLPNRTRLESVHFIDAQRGWVVGRDVPGTRPTEIIIARTADGGETWERLDDEREGELRAVHFASETLGWAVGLRGGTSIGDRGIILHTADGGLTWQQQADGLGAINDIYFVDAQYGWATGVNELLHTLNGGATWTSMSNRVTGRSGLSVNFFDRDHGWVVGSAGLILQTVDGGASWQSRVMTTNQLNKVLLYSEAVGWISGTNALLKYTNDPD
ncbi:WD40/YVTN/BNR-like repeat-containing protein [Marinimicrobium alkaliphilum]|uniref:WD40/YVTN/BNR-like repeat-containing protein n=1 Tax=Marinimicrobium alkaliphilum TaxID=2202654 RepID=UPI000DB990D3|nr:YCF48-related protein [Marinimicrobium alkaliphilum]